MRALWSTERFLFREFGRDLGAKKTFERMKTISGFEFIHESDSGSGGKNPSFGGQNWKILPPHDGGFKHGGERGEEKVKDKREKERERAQKIVKYFVKESVLRTSTSQLDLISITIVQSAPGERGHERLPL